MSWCATIPVAVTDAGIGRPLGLPGLVAQGFIPGDGAMMNAIPMNGRSIRMRDSRRGERLGRGDRVLRRERGMRDERACVRGCSGYGFWHEA